MRSNKRRTVFVIAPVPESVSHPNPTPLIVIISSCKPTQNKVNLETGDKRVTAPEGDIDWEEYCRYVWSGYCGIVALCSGQIIEYCGRQTSIYMENTHFFYHF